MRTLFGIGLAVAALGLAAGCGKKAGTSAPTGPAGIEGGWTLVSLEAGGKKSSAEKTIQATATQLIATKDNGTEDPLNYKLDPTKSPAEIDLTETRANGKTETMYGIYKLEGDTLTICAAMSDKPADRPKEFKTTPESKTMMMTLKKK